MTGALSRGPPERDPDRPLFTTCVLLLMPAMTACQSMSYNYLIYVVTSNKVQLL